MKFYQNGNCDKKVNLHLHYLIVDSMPVRSLPVRNDLYLYPGTISSSMPVRSLLPCRYNLYFYAGTFSAGAKRSLFLSRYNLYFYAGPIFAGTKRSLFICRYNLYFYAGTFFAGTKRSLFLCRYNLYFHAGTIFYRYETISTSQFSLPETRYYKLTQIIVYLSVQVERPRSVYDRVNHSGMK